MGAPESDYDSLFAVFGLIGDEYHKVEILHNVDKEHSFVRCVGGPYDGLQGKIKNTRLFFTDGEKGPKGGKGKKCTLP